MSSHPALTPVEVSMLMRFALSEGERSVKEGNLPFGAVVAIPGEQGLRVLGRGRATSMGHAGHAVKAALAGALEKRRPGESGIVVVATLEPCEECMDLLRGSPIRQLVYGLPLPSSGAHRVSLGRDSESMMCLRGFMVNECRTVLHSYVRSGAHAPADVAFVTKILQQPSVRPHAA